MPALRIILLFFLIVCAVAVSFSRRLLVSVSIYMAFSLVMAIVWLILESPDLAITEAAVGAGVTGILFFVMLKKIRSNHTNIMAENGADPQEQNAAVDRDMED